MVVVGEYVFERLSHYYNVLEKTGYVRDSEARKLLVLSFYKDFVMNDYRGLLSQEDYGILEQALDCLFGSSCLIPYPDYLKMGKLKLGEITEVAQRVKVLENTNVLKLIHDLDSVDNKDAASDMDVVLED